MREHLDARILGAVRFVDAIVRTPVEDRLDVAAPGVRFVRNRSNLFAISFAPGADDYASTFELPSPPPPPAAASISITLTVKDPSGRYLPRTATLAVPRDPDPAHAGQATSLFQPVDVELYPAPIARPVTGSAIVRLSVQRTGSGDGLPFAYIRVRRASDDVVLARGLADARGEALVPIPGIPVTTWGTTSTGSVTATGVHAKLNAYYDASAFDAAAGRYPDPAALERSFATLPHSADIELDLMSGREVTRRIELTP